MDTRSNGDPPRLRSVPSLPLPARDADRFAPLPVPRTPLIGRERDAAAIRALLGHVFLLFHWTGVDLLRPAPPATPTGENKTPSPATHRR